jgi:N utilization substance protein A
MSREIIEAMHALAREKGISEEKLMVALEDALLSAYKKQPGAARYARVDMDRDSGDFRVFRYKIPPQLEAHLIVETIDEGTTIDPETGEMVEPQDPEIDPAKFEQYRDQIEEEDDTPEDFGRIAAQTAKQVILQRIREAERDMMFEEYRDRVGELITGIVQQSDSRYTLVQLRERVEALLPKSEQVDGERYDHSQRIKAVIKEVSPSTKGPSIIVSRRDPELIKKLFELEVPEIADGLVEIANVAREPGYRSKIAVVSHADGVDPVGACVGPRGSRVRMVVSELRGEKIDIIPYNDEPARFVAKALSPARVREVLVDDDGRQATVVVPDDQLSLAIGREGQNARLAARLTGWRIDIRSETEFATEEQDSGYEQEEASGRCAAILANGRRCPNAALPGSRYCGLESHQALEHQDSDYVAGAAPGGDGEVPFEEGVEAAPEAVGEAPVDEGLEAEAVGVGEAPVDEGLEAEAVGEAPPDEDVDVEAEAVGEAPVDAADEAPVDEEPVPEAAGEVPLDEGLEQAPEGDDQVLPDDRLEPAPEAAAADGELDVPVDEDLEGAPERAAPDGGEAGGRAGVAEEPAS